MALLDLFKPKWKHSDPIVRRGAIEEITDQDVLRKVLYFDDDKGVLLAAIEKITDQDILAGAAGHLNSAVGKAAIKKITDQEVLFRSAISGGTIGVRLAAVDKISDQKELGRIARHNSTRKIKVALAALERITDDNVLDSILKDNEETDIRKAVGKKRKALAVIDQATLESCETFFVLGVDVPVITELKVFSRLVQMKGVPIGLFVGMDDFILTYGELQNSVPDRDKGGINPFHVGARNGPCRLFCSGCEMLLPDSFIFRLSGGLADAVGAKSVGECPKCGCKKAVIIFNPEKN